MIWGKDNSSKLSKLSELADEYSICENRCKLLRKKRRVYGSGNVNSVLMIVGIAPGEMEEEEGIPFVGPSGELLLNCLNKFGVRRDNVYMTNLVLCRPTNKLKEEASNRDPTKTEIDYCLPRLWREIYLVDPITILLLGKLPVQALARKNSEISKVVGKILMVAIKGSQNNVIFYPAIATYHPSFLLRYGTVNSPPVTQFMRDIERALTVTSRVAKEYKELRESLAWNQNVKVSLGR